MLQVATGVAIASMVTLVTFSAASGSAVARTSQPTLVISHSMFSRVTVHAGERFLVKNADKYDHTVKIVGSAADSLIHGHSYLIFTAPTKPGSYKLSCDLNKQMRGVLRVVH